MGAIKLEKIEKWFGDVQVIKGIDLEINDGEMVVFVGPSGCGKSTLLRMIAGLEETSYGEIYLDGEKVTDKVPSERALSMVFQSYALYPHMNVEENVGFGLKTAGMPRDEIAQKVRQASAVLELDAYLKRRPKELSGGQRQRVAIGRAIVREPKGFLFDEPLSNLDAALRVQMRFEIAKLHEKLKATMIYVTHDQVEAMSLADRISVMNRGEIVQAATPMEVYRNPAAEFVAGFIGNPPMNFVVADRSENNQWRVAGEYYPGPKSDADQIHFAIRPEDVVIADAGLDARVRLVEPLGAHLHVTCDVGGRMFRAVLDSGLEVKAGDHLKLQPQLDRIRWFDKNTTKALEV